MGKLRKIKKQKISRRLFMKSGILAGGALALAGCSWTPRNAPSSQNENESLKSGSGSQGNSSSTQNQPSENSQSTSIDDDLILVKGGKFTMGSPSDEPWRSEDETQHSVKLSDFYLSPIEVSEYEFNLLLGSGRNTSAANQEEKLPAHGITWFEAVQYCNELSKQKGLAPAYKIDGEKVSWNLAANGYRLPTEAEWEYACRAGVSGPFNLDHSISAEEANYYGHYPYEIEGNYFNQEVLDVQPGVYRGEVIRSASFPPNAWGFYDMHGNVAEWVWDYYGDYPKEDQDNPTGPQTGMLRVNRGGGWNDFAKNLRSAYRASMSPNTSTPSIGFRIARSAVLKEEVIGGSMNSSESKGETLLVYFSWSGNTRKIAQEISNQLGIEAIELECEQPYSTSYNTCLDEAQRDQNQNSRPALKTKIENMERYGTVYIGYPNWWASIPMPIATFLESYDFSNKEIRPFCSNGGGGLGQSVTTISKLAPTAYVGNGLSIYGSGGSEMSEKVSEWIKELDSRTN